MRIGIDTKNFALYSGGISHFFRPLLKAWVVSQPQHRFYLIGPRFDDAFLSGLTNIESVPVPIFRSLPGPMKHGSYDYLLAPAAIRKIAPDLFFSPYFDICVPSGIRFVITVHDLCFTEAAGAFPLQLRAYYLRILKRNIRRAAKIITVSHTSKRAIVDHYGIHPRNIDVVYNSFASETDRPHRMQDIDRRIRSRFHLDGGTSILYAGGLEFRKNIDRLVEATDTFAHRHDKPVQLLITGAVDAKSLKRWPCLQYPHRFKLTFTGFLERSELKQLYRNVDMAVYLSRCEGFGRVCLESMAAGTALVCSDLPVFHEVAGNFPYYCHPNSKDSVIECFDKALADKPGPGMIDDRYRLENNVTRFIRAVSAVSAK